MGLTGGRKIHIRFRRFKESIFHANDNETYGKHEVCTI